MEDAYYRNKFTENFENPLVTVKEKIQQCVIIDNQVGLTDVDEIKSKFENAEFKVDYHSTLTKEKIQTLFTNEILENEYSLLVFCIFAPFSTITKNEITSKAFLCENEKICIRILSNFIRKKKPNSSCPIFVLINDQNFELNSNKNEFHLLYQASDVYISFNTYPKSWFIQKLCSSLQLFKDTKCIGRNSCKLFSQLSLQLNGMFNLNTNKNLSNNSIETIISVSTNTSIKKEHQNLKDQNNFFFETHYPNNGMCIILNFKLNQRDDLVNCEDNMKNVELLENTFQNLGFRVNSFNEFNLDQIIELVSRFDHSSSNCFVLCLITHYQDGYVYTNSDKNSGFKLQIFFEFLNPTLNEKPKIMLIHDSFRDKNITKSSSSMKAMGNFVKIPMNFLIVYSTFPNDIEGSSNFLQTMCQIIDTHYTEYDFFTMIQMAFFATKQHSSVLIKSTLKKILFIFNQSKIRYVTNKTDTKKLISPIVQHKKLSSENIDCMYYPIKKGRCLLLSYTNENENAAKVTDKNIDLLISTFESLKFTVDILKDNKICSWSILQEGNEEDLKTYDCLVVFVFPNGIPEVVVDRDELFNNLTCKELMEKPKLFFVLGTNQLELDDVEAENVGKKIKTSPKKIKIPKYSNFLYFYSSEISETIKCLCFELLSSEHFDLNKTLVNVMNKLNINCPYSEQDWYLNSTLTQLVSFHQINESKFKIPKTVSNNKKKICYIFDFEVFKDDTGKVNKVKTRLGTNLDVDKLKLFFGKLNFDIKIYINLTYDEMNSMLEIIHKTDFSSYDCFVLCYLSHGNYGGLLECHESSINRKHLIKSIASNRKNDDLTKIFFIQACQGEICYDSILNEVEFDGERNPSLDNQSYQVYPNLFILSASYPNYVAFRNAKTGSYFIQKLSHFLESYYNDYDLATIASMVCKQVGYFENIEIQKDEKTKQVQQIPFLQSTMTKSIHFSKYESS